MPQRIPMGAATDRIHRDMTGYSGTFPSLWRPFMVRALLPAVVLGGLGASLWLERSPGVSLRPATQIRDVRVLALSGVEQMRLRTEGSLAVSDDTLSSLDVLPATEWITASPDPAGGIWLGEKLRPQRSLTVRPEQAEFTIVSVYSDGTWSPTVRYPGTLDLTTGEGGLLDVVNVVDVERYVAGVVANEVWPTFETEAYRAQAIAARTFVLYQMKRRQGAPVDVAATQGAQVYRGIRTDEVGRRAAEAAEYTRGIVLTYTANGVDELFCTYYNAVCGGVSQSAAIFGPDNTIEPLAGGVRCEYCRIAPGETYRWGPVRIAKEEVWLRLAAAYPKLASLGGIETIEVAGREQSGRIIQVRLMGTTGESYDMLAERFRLAVGGNVVRSTDCKIHVTEQEVIFDAGRGFGHGLGLCQWGMQGQALEGKQAGEILRYYYPGSKLTRVY